MSLPITLSSLSPREAIVDAVYRIVNAFDFNDTELFNSSLTEDAVLDFNGKPMEGRETIRQTLFEPVAKLDTTHFVTNIRVDIKEETNASVSTTTLAQHFRTGEGNKPGATRYMAGCLYTIDLVKHEKEGVWKIKYFKLKLVWTEGDQDVMTSSERA